MNTEKWWKNAVIYEIYCKSFYDTDGDGIGDLEGVIQKLPYLKSLGINCIWFAPIYVSPQVDNGYDVADYADIDKVYGGLPAFRRCLSEAHKLGIRIVMDMVLNHSSDENQWFIESRKSKDNPYRDYYIWKPPVDGHEPNNWGSVFREGNGSAWEFDETTGEYYMHLYAKKMPELNWECPALRKDIYKIMCGWLELGVDGFRLDVITKLKKPAGFKDSPKTPEVTGFVVDHNLSADEPGIHEIIRDIAKNTWRKYGALGLGEAVAINPENAELYLSPAREELDLAYHFQIVRRQVPVDFLQYKKIQNQWMALLDKGILTTQHFGNHDQPRPVSKFGDENYRARSAKALSVLNLFLPGTPFIYQGEEIGMINTYFDSIEDYNDRYTLGEYKDLVLAGKTPEEALRAVQKSSRDNARTPIPWNGSENGGFSTGKPWMKLNPNYREINVESDLSSADSVFRFYQKAIAMRTEHDAVSDGDFRFYDMDNPQTVIFKRESASEKLLIFVNVSSDEIEFSLKEIIPEKESLQWTRILTNIGDDRNQIPGSVYRPWECNIYCLKK